MAVEKYSVEIKDNATEVSHNIEKLTAELSKLTKAISANEQGERQAVRTSKEYGESNKGFLKTLGSGLATIGTWALRLMTVGTTLVFVNDMMSRMGMSTTGWFANLKKSMPLAAKFSQGLSVIGNWGASNASMISGMTYNLTGLSKAWLDGSVIGKKFTGVMSATRISASGAARAVEGYSRSLLDTVKGEALVQAAIIKTGELRNKLGEIIRPGIPMKAFQRRFGISPEQYKRLAEGSKDLVSEVKKFSNVQERAAIASRKVTGALKGQEKAIFSLSHWIGKSSTQYQGMNLAIALVMRKMGKWVSNVGKAMANSLVDMAIKASKYEVTLKALSVATEQFNKHTHGAKLAQDGLAEWVNRNSAALGIQAEEFAQVTALMFDYASLAKLDEAQVKKLVVRTADLAAVMHVSLSQAFQTVISGVSTTSINLRKLNIRLKEAELAQEGYLDKSRAAAGQITEEELAIARLNAMLQQSDQYGGLAEKRAETFAGALDRMAVAADNMSRTIGEGMVKILRPFLDVIAGVQIAFAHLPIVIQKFIGTVQALIAVLLILSGTLLTLVGTFGAIVAVIKLIKILGADLAGTLTKVMMRVTLTSRATVLAAASGKDFTAVLKMMRGATLRLVAAIRRMGRAMMQSYGRQMLLAVRNLKIFTKANLMASKAVAKLSIKLAAIFIAFRAVESAADLNAKAIDRVNESVEEFTITEGESYQTVADASKAFMLSAEVIGIVLNKAYLILTYSVNGFALALGYVLDALGVTNGMAKRHTAILEALGDEIWSIGDDITHIADKYDLWGKKKEKNIDDTNKEIIALQGLERIQTLHKFGLLDVVEAEKELEKIRAKAEKIRTKEAERRSTVQQVEVWKKEVAQQERKIQQIIADAQSTDYSFNLKTGSGSWDTPYSEHLSKWEKDLKKLTERLGVASDAAIVEYTKAVKEFGHKAQQEWRDMWEDSDNASTLARLGSVSKNRLHTASLERLKDAEDAFEYYKKKRDEMQEQWKKWHIDNAYSMEDWDENIFEPQSDAEAEARDRLFISLGPEELKQVEEYKKIHAAKLAQSKEWRDAMAKEGGLYDDLRTKIAETEKALETQGMTSEDTGALEAELALLNLLGQKAAFVDEQLAILRAGIGKTVTAQEALDGAELDFEETQSRVLELYKKAGVEIYDMNTGVMQLASGIRDLAVVNQVEMYPAISAMIEKFLEWKDLQEELGPLYGETWDFLKQTGLIVADAFENTLVNAFDAVMDGTFKVKDAIANMGSSILRTFADIAASTITKKLVELLGKLAISMFSGGGAPNQGIGEAGGLLIGGNSGPAMVPEFQHGGVVTQPTLGMVGEAGPEAVIPLDKLGDFNKQQQVIVVNLTGRPEDVVQSGITSNPDVVINPILQDARFGGRMRQAFR